MAAKNDDKAVALARFDDDLRVARLFDFAREQRAQLFRDFRFDPARAAVGDDALFVERAKIGARGDVARLEFHAQTEGFDHAAAHLKFQRIITK